MTKNSVLDILNEQYNLENSEELTLSEYLERCKEEPMAYASIHERLLEAIGTPEVVDTREDPRLNRIFSGRTIRRYPAFKDFYGIEDTVEQIVSFLRHAAQGLEERKQILYLLGPVGSSKSSLAERIKALAEKHPIYVLKAGDEISPVFESPLGLFHQERHGEMMEEQYNIPRRHLTGLCSPWAVKRLRELGDVNKFKVVKINPSILEQIGIVKTEPGDDNNQDISALVGKVDLRKLEDFSQDDPDAYSYCGTLNRGNQGVMEFVEMFKAPLKMLHPLLTATQEGNYKGTENIPAMPFHGMILSHSNESEWQKFKNDNKNEAFLDRVCVIKVPYNLRVMEEVDIYNKYLRSTNLKSAPCAPETLNMLAKFTVLSRIDENPKCSQEIKMRAYNGEELKNSETKSVSVQELRDDAGVDEGMKGLSTRFAFKLLNKTFNFDPEETAADPVHLMNVVRDTIVKEQFPEEKHEKLMVYLDGLRDDYTQKLMKEVQRAYIESYKDYGQAQFDKYVSLADSWLQETDYRDPDTGNMMDRQWVERELEKIEIPANIVNAKDFRNEVVNFCLRYQAKNEGANPSWQSYEKMREIIEDRMFASMNDILPVISFEGKKDSKTKQAHEEFVERMKERGYTTNQIKRLVGFLVRSQK